MKKMSLIIISLCLFVAQSKAQRTARGGTSGATGQAASGQAASVQAQLLISGKVTDIKSGAPVYGVTVSAGTGSNSVRTDKSGSYSITVSTATQNLVFSMPGYKQESKTFSKTQTLNVALLKL